MLTTKELCEVTNLWGHESLTLEMANGWVVELERHTSSDRTHFSLTATPSNYWSMWKFYGRMLTPDEVDAHLAKLGGVTGILDITPFE